MTKITMQCPACGVLLQTEPRIHCGQFFMLPFGVLKVEAGTGGSSLCGTCRIEPQAFEAVFGAVVARVKED